MCFEFSCSILPAHTHKCCNTIISTQKAKVTFERPFTTPSPMSHKRDDDEAAQALSSNVVAALHLEEVISTMYTSLDVCSLTPLFPPISASPLTIHPAEPTTKDIKRDNYCGGRKL